MFVILITLISIVIAVLLAVKRIDPMYGAPFVPLEKSVVNRVMKLLKIKKGDIFYDLGSGDGRMVIEAAKLGALAYGVEINPFLVFVSKLKIRRMGLSNTAKIINKNLFKVDLSPADAVSIYLLKSTNELLLPKLEKELKPGAKIVSAAFILPGWKPEKIDPKGPIFGPLYLYKKIV